MLLTFILLAKFRRESVEDIELINPELVPVQQFVETCTKELAKEALQLIGFNGGYIYFPEWIDAGPGRVLQPTPNNELRNPLWWFDGTMAIPTLQQIEGDMNRFILEGLPRCLNNFTAFHDRYIIEELGSMQVVTLLGEEDGVKEDVTVRTEYPLKVKDKFNTTLAELQKFVITLPIRFNKIYNLAKDIMEREKADFFIEQKALDLINLDRQIPTTGIEFNCKKKIWEKQKVEERIKKLISVNFNHIKIKGAKYDPDAVLPYFPDPLPQWKGKVSKAQVKQMSNTKADEKDFDYLFKDSDNTFKDSYYNAHYVWDVTDNKKDYKNTRVNVQYDGLSPQGSWPFVMKISPSSGPILQSGSQKGTKYLSAFCINTWHFTYSLSFPVKVTIVDEKTPSNSPYTFSFAFMAKILKNYPDKSEGDFATFSQRSIYTSDEYCADLSSSHDMFFIAKDAVTETEINNVNLTFTCGRYTCPIGRTKPDYDSNGLPLFKGRVPVCNNGILRGIKEGYEDGEMFIQTEFEKAYYLDMQPVKYFNISVIKHRLDANNMPLSQKPLEASEQALIILKYPPKKFESYAILEGSSSPEAGKLPPLKLLAREDITYEVELYITDNETMKGGWLGNVTIGKDANRLGSRIIFHAVEEDFKKDDDLAYLFFEALPELSKKIPIHEVR